MKSNLATDLTVESHDAAITRRTIARVRAMTPRERGQAVKQLSKFVTKQTLDDLIAMLCPIAL